MLSRWVDNLRILGRAACVHPVSTTGLWVSSVTMTAFVVHEVLRAAGIVTNATVGLFAYLGLLGLFAAGLVALVIGWILVARTQKTSIRALIDERVPGHLRSPGTYGSPLLFGLVSAVAVSAVFMTGGSVQMLHFMDTPKFCGTACHTMAPEWAAYPHSAHRNVPCVKCHVGTGVKGLVKAKVNGTWEMISVTFDLYERPIPVPAHPSLPPSKQTCQKCHSRSRAYGQHIKTFVRHEFDEHSTPTYTTVALKLGTGHGNRPTGIHWHTAQPEALRYMPANRHLTEIRWVDFVDQAGTSRRYTNTKLSPTAKSASPRAKLTQRNMDCIDCHNRPAHQFQSPQDAVDEAIARGSIDRGIPYIKRVAYGALTQTFRPDWPPSKVIDQHVNGYYARQFPQVYNQKRRSIDRAVTVLQKIYARNIHPTMNVGWNTYASNLGHRGGHGGCFRCHNPDMKDDRGRALPHDCNLCHDLLAYDSKTPFEVFRGVWKRDRQGPMYETLLRDYAKRSGMPLPNRPLRRDEHEPHEAPPSSSQPSPSPTP